MRTDLAVSIAVLTGLPVLAQNPPVDLSQWTTEHINGAGPWTVDAPRLFTNSTNVAVTDASVLYSNFTVSVLEFRMSVDPAGGDDDFIGFVLGWNPGDSGNTTADYLLVDWKAVTQAYQNWGTATAGLALSHVVGTFVRGSGGGPIDLWSHTGCCTQLARGNNWGQRPWAFSTPYYFRVVFTPATVDIWLDNQLEFHATGTFNQGRFGCYNYSQSRMEFQFPAPGSFNGFGTGCIGSAGRPYLFSPETPFVGENLPVIVANLPPLSPAIVVLGASNTSWAGNPLPLSLAPFGGGSCTAYISGDVYLPATNYNGTAFLYLRIPSTLLPSSAPVFFTQGVAIDPSANALGIVLSNAAAAVVGIH